VEISLNTNKLRWIREYDVNETRAIEPFDIAMVDALFYFADEAVFRGGDAY